MKKQLCEMVKASTAVGLTGISGEDMKKLSVEANATMAITWQYTAISNRHAVHLNLYNVICQIYFNVLNAKENVDNFFKK